MGRKDAPALRWVAVVGLVLVGLACGPGAATGAPSEAWQADWERTLAAARQEGKLVVSAPQGELYREALTAFEKEYPQIRLDYTAMSARDLWPRMRQEREA